MSNEPKIDRHEETCSRVASGLPLPAYVKVQTGECTECGRVVSKPETKTCERCRCEKPVKELTLDAGEVVCKDARDCEMGRRFQSRREESRPLSDAELVALGALVQADAVDVECENKRVLVQQASVARLNNDVCNVEVRSVADCPSYKRLAEELGRRLVLR